MSSNDYDTDSSRESAEPSKGKKENNWKNDQCYATFTWNDSRD